MATLTNGATGAETTYANADFDDGGHDEAVTDLAGASTPRFIAALGDVARHGATLFQGVSSTSIAIADAGPFAVTCSKNRPFYDGSWVRLEDASDSNNYIEGTVSSADPDAGTFTLTKVLSGGSGTISSWKVFGMGRRGATGATGPKGDTGGITYQATTIAVTAQDETHNIDWSATNIVTVFISNASHTGTTFTFTNAAGVLRMVLNTEAGGIVFPASVKWEGGAGPILQQGINLLEFVQAPGIPGVLGRLVGTGFAEDV